MTSTTWEAVIEVAAAASQEGPRGAALVALLQRALAGRVDEAAVAAVTDSGDAGTAPFLRALDRAIRAQRDRWDEATLAAVRAALAVLPRLLSSIAVLGPDGSLEADGVREQLDALVERAARRPDPGATALRCPRCGSRDVDEQHSGGLGARLVEVCCLACSLYDSWTEGDPHRWSP